MIQFIIPPPCWEQKQLIAAYIIMKGIIENLRRLLSLCVLRPTNKYNRIDEVRENDMMNLVKSFRNIAIDEKNTLYGKKNRHGMKHKLFPLDSTMKVIGAGGFGTIYGNRSHVYKMFNTVKTCTDSKHEFDIGLKLYKAIKRLRLEDKITTPTPIDHDIKPFEYNGQKYRCFFKMQRVDGFVLDQAAGRELLVHATLQYPNKNAEVAKMDEPVSDLNPSRGWFAGENFIKTITGAEPKDIAYRIGLILVILIMDVGICPFDVEFLVNKKGQLVVLDFGLAYQIESYNDMISLTKKIFEDGGNGAIGLAYDLYYPAPDSKVKQDFLDGINEGIRLCRYPKKAEAISKFVKEDLSL